MIIPVSAAKLFSLAACRCNTSELGGKGFYGEYVADSLYLRKYSFILAVCFYKEGESSPEYGSTFIKSFFTSFTTSSFCISDIAPNKAVIIYKSAFHVIKDTS